MLSRLLQRFSRDIPTDRAERGRLGEQKAARYLKKQGLRVLARNWRAGRDEIDLVCSEGEVLVFVEVRTRDASALVGGYHSVTEAKKVKLRRACKAYIKALRTPPRHTRFDIVEVKLGPGQEIALYHHPNVSLFHH